MWTAPYIICSNIASVFDPRFVPNLEGWFDAADSSSLLATSGGSIVTEFGTVGQFLDKSGKSRHLEQSSSGARPERDTLQLCGKPGVRFSGNQSLIGSGLTADKITVFCVWQSDTTSGTIYELSADISSNPGIYLSNTTAASIYARNIDGVSIKDTLSSSWGKAKGPMITRHVSDGTHNGHLLFDRGVSQTLSNAGGTTDPGIMLWGPSAFYVGSRFDDSLRSTWTLCELIIYSGTVSPTNIGLIEEYIYHKWNAPRGTGSVTRNIVCVGDSKTLGLPGDLAHSYPTLLGQYYGPVAEVTNKGIGSYTLALAIDDAASQVDPLIDPLADYNILCVRLGSNDIGLASGTDGTTLWNMMVLYLQARRAAGWLIVLANIDARAWVNNAVVREGYRTTYNTLSDSNWASVAEAYVNLAADPVLGPAGSENNSKWYIDGVHETVRGYIRVANYFFIANSTLVANQIEGSSPLVTSITGSPVERFSGPANIVVVGDRFTVNSVIRINDIDQATTFIDEQSLSCIAGIDITNENGDHVVKVYDIGTGLSNSRYFIVSQPTWLYLEYRFDKGVTLSSGLVSTLLDQSGNLDPARDLSQATTNRRPTFISADNSFNNKPSASFDGTSGQEDSLEMSGTFSVDFTQPTTHFFVGNTSKANTAQAYDGNDGSFRQTIWCDPSGNVALYSGAVLSTALPFNVPRIVCGEFNGVNSKIFVSSKTAAVTGNAGSLKLQTISLGSSGSHINTWGSTGKIVYLGIVNGILSSTVRNIYLDYLGNKYGITISA